MKLTLLLISILIRTAMAQSSEDSSAVHFPYTTRNCPTDSLSVALSIAPGVCPDGIVLGNMKYFIRILKTDPSIDPGMIRMIPDFKIYDHMPGLREPLLIPHPGPVPSPQFK